MAIDEGDTEKVPQRLPAEERAPRERTLTNGLWFLAAGTIFLGSCSGLSSGCESLALFAPKEEGRMLDVSKRGHIDVKIAAEALEGPLTTGSRVVRLVYAFLCAGAVFLAGATLAKTTAFNPWAGLSRLAAGMAALRLLMAGLDYLGLEKAMELVREAARKSPGYSYAKTGELLNAAEGMGTTLTVLVALALGTFWAITAVGFWEIPARAERAKEP